MTQSFLAHGGHALYDHPAMMAISLAALIIPLIVLGVVGRIFWRSAKDEERQKQPPAPPAS